LQAAYDAQCADVVKENFDLWQRSMSDGFVLTTASGKKESRDELVTNARSASANGIKFSSCSAALGEITQDGTTITVATTGGAEGTMPAKGGVSEIVTSGTSIDTWSFVDGQLVETSSTDTDGQITVDGKVVEHDHLPPPTAGATALAAVDPKIENAAKDWLHRFQTGNIDYSQMSDRVSAKLTPALAQQIQETLKPLGDPISFTYLGSQVVEGINVYGFLVTFKDRQLNEFFALDANGKIAGITFKPPQ
jgi:hypothetical protein